MTTRVLVVCLGNICRSPTAEAAVREAAADAGVDLEVDSAGTGAWHVGNPPDRRMTAAAAEDGLELAGQARQATVDDFRDFDLVVAMGGEAGQWAAAAKIWPRAAGQLLSDHAVLAVRREPFGHTEVGEQRPMPVRLEPAAATRFQRRTATEHLEAAFERCRAALARGESQSEVMASWYAHPVSVGDKDHVQGGA